MQGSKHVFFYKLWKYLCKKRVTYLNILINIVFCKDLFHFISFSEAKVASSALSWSFFTLRSRHRSGVKTLLMGVRVHCFPLISIRLIQIQTKKLSNFQKRMWTNMCKPSLFPNSHDWFIKKFHFMDEKSRSIFSQKEDGTLRYQNRFSGRAPWTHPPMQQQSRGPHFLTPPGEKKNVGTMQSVMSKKLIWLKSC